MVRPTARRCTRWKVPDHKAPEAGPATRKMSPGACSPIKKCRKRLEGSGEAMNSGRRPLIAANWKMNGLKADGAALAGAVARSEEHTSELQSQSNLVCRLL